MTTIQKISILICVGLFVGCSESTEPKSKNHPLKDKLRLERNEIFARHGRIFKSPDLIEYFSSKSWYKPNEQFSSDQLSKREILAVNTLKELEDGFDSCDERDLEEVELILGTISYHYRKPLDTTFISVGELDGRHGTDTIKTHVFEKKEDCHVEYTYTRNDSLLWRAEVVNPYLWFGDCKLSEAIWENLFIRIFTGYKCVADISKMGPHEESVKNEWALSIGVEELNTQGYQISDSTYQIFLDNFNSDILHHSHDEGGGQLQIWYEPAKRFVTFYAP